MKNQRQNYQVREIDRLSHGEVIDDEPAESVIERVNAHFGARALVARHVAPVPGASSIPVGISARHVHLSRAHCDALFGAGYELAVRHLISQPGPVCRPGDRRLDRPT